MAPHDEFGLARRGLPDKLRRCRCIETAAAVLCLGAVLAAQSTSPRDLRRTALTTTTPSAEIVRLDIDGDRRPDLVERTEREGPRGKVHVEHASGVASNDLPPVWRSARSIVAESCYTACIRRSSRFRHPSKEPAADGTP